MIDCIFCKIVSGDIPNHTVYEDDHFLAFLDINPHAKGHTVVIPKVHAETLFGLSEELQRELLPTIRLVMERIQRVLHPDGYTVGWNHGEAGGQVVPHVHIHVFPRFEGDGGSSVHSVVNAPGQLNVADVAKLFERI